MREKKKQNGDLNSTNFILFFVEISFDTPVLKVLVFASDLEFWIEVNEYY